MIRYPRPSSVRRALIASALSLAFISTASFANDPKELVIGTSAGPYADQVKLGIKPILEKQGYKVKVVEFNDYIQPNFALAEGALNANAFQHIIYLTKFAADNKLALSELIKVPTAPIAIYSKKHKSLTEVKEGTTVALPNDPTNQARALVLLEQLGWIKLRANYDPIRVSDKDVADNIKKIKLIPLEAAQLPRSLQDTDYSFVNGNFALASGLKLTEALAVEKTSETYQNLVAIRTADKGKQWVKDLEAAYRSREFLDVTNKYFSGFAKPDYQQTLQSANK
ncbi:MetQ/NlpA family ABC transporter substrate-binding protein [Undibacterium terreum]|uniref:Lipoprotein n=1 Tax=Undibacterium terreum TaxID=1224302 RepID=A0A916XAH8_9BURK|nr:MetQ/NlpA family ABC transporter substrate-binding protein [Undibacterium terreum]GGC57265.1 lipoprotein [Undibacterium terreum]